MPTTTIVMMIIIDTPIIFTDRSSSMLRQPLRRGTSFKTLCTAYVRTATSHNPFGGAMGEATEAEAAAFPFLQTELSAPSCCPESQFFPERAFSFRALRRAPATDAAADAEERDGGDQQQQQQQEEEEEVHDARSARGDIVCVQDISDVGGTVWDAEIVLAHLVDEYAAVFFAERERELEEEESGVLEIGAGTGLAGMVCCALAAGRERVVLSDLDAVLGITEENVKRNGLRFERLGGKEQEEEKEGRTAAGGRVQLCELEWGNEEHIQVALRGAEGAQRFRLILAADVLYHEEHFQALRDTLDQVATPGARVLIAYEQRRKDLGPFFEAFPPDRFLRTPDEALDEQFPLLRSARALANVHVVQFLLASS